MTELYLALSYREPRQLVTLAPIVERLGYDGVSVPDHVAMMEHSGGIGVGWQRVEFAVVDEVFETRGSRTDEAIELMRACWTQRLADGFVAVPHTVDDTVALATMMRRRLAESGRGDVPFHINGDCTDVRGPADLARLEEAGVTSLLVRALPSPPPPGTTLEQIVAELEDHAATTLAAWRG